MVVEGEPETRDHAVIFSVVVESCKETSLIGTEFVLKIVKVSFDAVPFTSGSCNLLATRTCPNTVVNSATKINLNIFVFMSGNQTKTTGSWPGGIHFLAGGVAGTIGAAITCPLEVVKTRLQSSLYKQPVLSNKGIVSQTIGHINGVFSILSGIYRNEGVRALW